MDKFRFVAKIRIVLESTGGRSRAIEWVSGLALLQEAENVITWNGMSSVYMLVVRMWELHTVAV